MIVSYFKGIRQVILQELEKAHEEINVAVCWFTNNQLFDILCEKVKNNISVTLIVLNDSINNRDNGLDFQKFIDLGGKFYFGDIDKPMHNKYCLIDNKTLINGSYNWTYLAETNEENINVITEGQTIQSFKDDFKRLMLITQPVNTIKEVANKDPKKSNIVEGSIIASTDVLIIESKQIISDSLYLISSVGESLHEDKFQVFFAKDTLIPSSKEITLTTVYDKQITCGKNIRFGENKIGSLNQFIGEFHVTGIPELPKGIPGLITTFEIDYNRILTVKVKIRENNKTFINKYDICKLIEKR